MNHTITVTSEELDIINHALEFTNEVLLEYGEEPNEERNDLWDRLTNQYENEAEI